jgi:hypothetical protein
MAKNHASSRRGRARQQQVVALLSSAPWRRMRGHRAGAIVGGSARSPLVDYPGNPHGPIAARTIAALPERAAGDPPREALLVFEDERSDRPIVVGLLAPAADGRSTPGRAITALVDGKQVVIDAQDEIVLRCGEASITLRRNGRVVIRGAYVETRSRGVNRIKGGSVQIN